jgi:hypothetical protein
MVPEDKDRAYALLCPLVDPIKKKAASDEGKVRAAYFRRKMLTATNDRRAYIRRRSVEVAVCDGAIAHITVA